MNELENLLIYKTHLDLIYYTEYIIKKYPKSEREALCVSTRMTVYEIMKKIILSAKEINKSKRIIILNELDVDLKMLKVYIRIAFKNKYISATNYGAWSRKITDVNNLLFGWIKRCLKQ